MAPAELPRAFNRQSVWQALRDRARRARRQFPARDRCSTGCCSCTACRRRSRCVGDAAAGHARGAGAGLQRGDTVARDRRRAGRDLAGRALARAAGRRCERQRGHARGAIDRGASRRAPRLDLSRVRAPTRSTATCCERIGLRLYRPRARAGDRPGGRRAAPRSAPGCAPGDRVIARRRRAGADAGRSWSAAVRASRGTRAALRRRARRRSASGSTSRRTRSTQNGERIGRIGAAPRIDPAAHEAAC